LMAKFLFRHGAFFTFLTAKSSLLYYPDFNLSYTVDVR
jgi:hypothetical protein